MDLDCDNFNSLTDDKKLNTLVYLGTLAASSHNTQPWLFKINENGKTIEVCANNSRRLKDSDPEGRELFLSLGAATENLEQAITSFGLDYVYEEKDHSTEPSAVFKLNSLQSPRLDTFKLKGILNRHSNRYPFDQKPLPQSFIDWIKSLNSPNIEIKLITNYQPVLKNKINSIVLNAIESGFHDKIFTRELSQWIRPSLKRYRDGMPGYNIGIPWLFSLIMPWAIRYIPMAGMQRAMNKKMLDHCSGIAVISTNGNDPASWFKAGRIYERVALEAERFGLKQGVFGAPIEIGSFYKDLQNELFTKLRPQMVFRLGVTKKVPPRSPRLNLHSVIIEN